MNIPSLLRSLRQKFFGRMAPRRKPYRRYDPLELELLETRTLLTTAPHVLAVSPANLTTWNSATEPTPSPTITVQFNEAMYNPNATDAHSVTNPANYQLFDDTTGAAITINSVKYTLNADNTSTVTVKYATGAGNVLNDGTYTLFLEGQNLYEASDTDALAEPGQLVVANTNNGTVSTINTGPTGAPEAAQSYPMAQDGNITPAKYDTPQPAAVCVADLNGDGIADVAVANSNTGTVEVFLGRANGGFNDTPDAILYLSDSPLGQVPGTITGLVAADLGNPNYANGLVNYTLPDLVTSDTTGVVNVFVNETVQGSSTLNFVDPFSTPVNLPNTGHAYAAGTDPVGLAVSDFFGGGVSNTNVEITVVDGKVDASANKNFDVTIIPSDGEINGIPDGALETANSATIAIGTATTGLENPTGIAVGDLNGDGLPDFVVSGSNGVLPFLNQGTSPFTFTADGQGGTNTPLGVSGGKPVAFNSVAVGSITPSSVTFAQNNAFSGATVDDIAATTPGANSQLWAFTNNGSGGFSNAQSASFNLSGSAQSVVLADLTGGNGLADAVVASPSSNAFEVLVDTTSGTTASFSAETSYPVDNGPVALAVGDLNGGTTPDVVTANVTIDPKTPTNDATGPSFSTGLGNGDGTFADIISTVKEATKSVPTPNPESIAVGDLTGDGLNDLVVADAGANQVEVYLATAPGIYASPVIYSTLDGSNNGADPISVTLADLTGATYANGAPILDIVTADGSPGASGNSYVSIIANVGDGSGTFQAATTLVVGQNPTQVVAGVFDAAGGKTSADLLVAHDGVLSKGVTFLLNTTVSGGPISFRAGVELPIVNTNVNFTPTALAVADFNNDGKLDFVLLNSNNQAPSIYLVEGDGKGGFTSVQGPYALASNLAPAALAVADLTRNGYQDVVVVGQPLNGGTAAVETLLNNHGFGFDANVTLSSTGLPGGAIPVSVAITDVNDDPYPDLIVGTSYTPISLSNPPTVDNLFTLAGVGNGVFGSPEPYEAGGEPNPEPFPTPVPPVDVSPVAVVSDPFLAVLTFFQTGPLVTTNLIENGQFAAADLTGETGNLDGWQTVSERDSEGEWSVLQASTSSATISPLSGSPVINPPVGQDMAMLDQYNLVPIVPGTPPNQNPNLTASASGGYNGSYNGSNFLYQTFTLPKVTIAATLSLDLFVDNITGKWYTPLTNPLDYNENRNDEQVVIDFIAAPGTPQDVTTATALTGGVVFQTTASTRSLITPNGSTPNIVFNLPAGFLSTYGGQQITLRIAGVNNNINPSTDPNPPAPLLIGVDDVQLNLTFEDTTTPTLTGLRLRNPGQATGPNGVSVTNDATILGRVGDAGGVGAFAAPGFVSITTLDSTTKSTTVSFITQFDAQGNFAFVLPNVVPGLVTVTVQAQDLAGNFITQTLSFEYQGASLTSWEAVGPSAISTAGTSGVGYSSVSGRVTAIGVDAADPSGNTFYVGSENGGVWKTTDGGADWTPLTDFITNQSGQPINVPVGAIAVSTSSPNTIYVATGDGNILADSVGGVGVLVSIDGGQTWSVDGNTGTLLAGDRITAMAVDPDNANIVYVAVAGGPSGPGVFRTLNGLATASPGPIWSNILLTANMGYPTVPGNPAHGVPPGTTLASVTSLYLDPFNSDQVTIGLGNIGLAPTSSTAGLWISPNANNASGATWTALIGGDNATIPNNTVPQGTGVGRVTVAEGSGIGNGEKVFYALVGNPTSASPVTGGSEGFGTEAGLYKSSDGGLNWTKIQLLQMTNVAVDSAGDIAPVYTPIDLLGNDAGNVGSLAVDPTDPSVVYVGGSNGYKSAAGSYLDHGLIEVDTGDMMDATPQGIANAQLVDEIALVVDKLTVNYVNSGDDFQKALTAYGDSLGYYVPAKKTFQYVAEGVSWYDLSSGLFEGGGGEGMSWYDPALGEYVNWDGVAPSVTAPFPGAAAAALPPQVLQLTVDPQGRVLVGTEEGLWRLTNHGIGYDFTSDGFGIMSVAFVGNGGNTPTPNITITTLNSNLQIADLTSVAIDPQNVGTFYAAGYGTGIERTSPTNPGQWQTMGLNGPLGQVDAGTVLTAAPDPSAPTGTPTTLYVNWAFNVAPLGVDPYDPLISTQGGAIGSFSSEKNAGISINDTAGFFPVLAIDPTKIYDNGLYQDELFFGTNDVYTTRTSSNKWNNLDEGHPLSSTASSYVTAAAIAPSDSNFFYAGTNNGEVFVTQNNGVDAWPERDTGLPTGAPGAVITSFAVNPNNPLIAFVTIGGTGAYAHVFMTTNGGGSWTAIQGNLPSVPALSIVTDPRPNLSAGAPNGYLYIGTEVGAFESLNGGTTWKRLGAALPNVPVVSLSFNLAQEELIAGTQGRGVFVLSTDHVGAHVVSETPATPVPDNPGLSSVTVTFNKAINDLSFTPAQVDSITGPHGAVIWNPATSAPGTITVTDVSVTPLGQSNPHNTFQITFPTQTTDGVYTFVIGPDITDDVGNEMDQNQNGINGEPGIAPKGDEFSFQVAVNSTDDGAFVTGLYNDLLGRSADTQGFLNLMNLIEPTRFSLLNTFAQTYVTAPIVRAALLANLDLSTNLSTLGIGNLYPLAATQNGENYWNSQFAAGVPTEALINAIVADANYFNQTRTGHDVAGIDSNWVNQVYVDLLGETQATTGQLNQGVTQLQNAETNARLQQALALLYSPTYTGVYVTNEYTSLLGRLPSAWDLGVWTNLIDNKSVSDVQFVADLMGSTEYFNRAPTILSQAGNSNTYSPTEAFVRAVFSQLEPGQAFNSNPGADPSINFWVTELKSGAYTQASFATFLMLHGTYFSDPTYGIVEQDFTDYLGISAPPKALAYWSSFLQSGNPVQTFQAVLISSQTFFNNHVGSDTQLSAQDTDWINGMYSTLVGATDANGNPVPTSSQLSQAQTALATAEYSARLSFAQQITSSQAWHNHLTTNVYNEYLGRNPSAAELSAWNSILSMPSAGPGQPTRVEQLLIGVLGSQEYFYRQTDSNGLHSDNAWLTSLYPALGLAPNPTNEQYQLNNLLAAYAPQRSAAIQVILTSQEYYGRLVNNDFEKFLGRAPSSASLSYWKGTLAAGVHEETMIAALVASQEYFNRAPTILNITATPTNTTFLEALHLQLFPTDPTLPASGLIYWVNLLNSGALSRQTVATLWITGTKYYFDPTGGVIELIYQQYLGINVVPNPPAPILPQSYWESIYPNFRDQDVILALLDTPQYFLKPHQFP